MNILQKIQIYQQIVFQLPMIIVAVYVINRERKLIGQTLKNWWKWMWDWGKWPEERKNYYWILLAGVATFFAVILIAFGLETKKMIKKNKTELKEEMVKDGLTTQKKLKKAKEKRKKKRKNLKKKEGEILTPHLFLIMLPFIVFLPW